MSDYKRTELADPGILARISEAEVAEWMAALLESARADLPASSFSITAWFRDYRSEGYYDVCFGMHAADKCTGSQPDITSCLAHLKEELWNNPKKRAEEARRKARELNKEAAVLELMVLGGETR